MPSYRCASTAKRAVVVTPTHPYKGSRRSVLRTIFASFVTLLALGASEAFAQTGGILPEPPSYCAAYATSASSIRVYWQQVPGASSYRIYRSAVSGAQNLLVPTAVASASAAWLDDAGLQANQDYYYVVTAVVNGVESTPSEEDSHFPNSEAIPWGASPSVLANNVAASAGSDPGLPFQPVPGNARLMGPNAAIYQEGQTAQLPPDGSLNPDDLIMRIPTDEIPIPRWADPTPPNPNAPKRIEGGGFRRVVSLPTVNGMPVTGVSGTFYLPSTADGSLFNLRTPPVVPEAPYAYLGLTSQDGSIEIDAGLAFSPAKTINGTSYLNRWNGFIRLYEGKTRKNSSGRPLPLRVMGMTGETNYISSDGQLGNNALINLYVNKKRRTCRLYIFGLDEYGLYYARFYEAACKIEAKALDAGSKLQMKRVMSIAQSIPVGTGTTPFTNPLPAGSKGSKEYLKTGTYIKNLGWDNGKLYFGGTRTDWLNAFCSERYSSVPPVTLRTVPQKEAATAEYVDIVH